MIAPIELFAPAPPATLPPPSSRVEQLQQTVSASRLSLWHQCRLKFYFRYVLKLVKPPTPSLHVGKVVHAILQAWSKARWRKEPFSREQFKSLFEREWEAQQQKAVINWEGEESLQRSGAWSLLEMYFGQSPIPPEERPEAVEVPMEADLASHGLPILIGILDLVRPRGRIVDFKTAAQSPNSETAAHLHETQTSAYAVLYREATGRKESGIELHYLVKTKVPKLVVTAVGPMRDQQQSRLFRSIESYVAGLEREDFVPSPGFHCSSCEYLKECRAWAGKEPYA